MSSPTPAPGWRAAESPFHAGELAAQERAGVRERMNVDARRGIRDYMPEQHRQFFAEQPFMVLSGLDASGQAWPTLRVGEPGFISTPDEHTLRIAGRSLPGDPLATAWQVGGLIGGLGIQPATRRRNRVNGVITAMDNEAFTVNVSQSFGNCAKYIQGRTPEWIAAGSEEIVVSELSAELSDADRALLARADTFFIASANASSDAGLARGADVSHRGGKPGFIRVDDAHTLTTPDFSGNLFFNTIGNLTQDPRAGLLVIDFESGDLLYIAAVAEIIWDGAELASFTGAERLMRFHVREVRRTPRALPFRWSAVQYAPQLAKMGSWQGQSVTLPSAASGWRKMRVVDVQDETPTARSFYLQPVDGSALPHFEPGQFLPIRLQGHGLDAPLMRTYTLSDAHHGKHFRITVKREGAASTWLHEQIKAGMEIEAKVPGGSFTLDRTSRRPVVLLSAGIGITPMISMLNTLLASAPSEAQTQKQAQAQPEHIYFIHGARHSNEHPFEDELASLAQRHPNLSVYLRDSQPAADGSTHPAHSTGRADVGFLKQVLPFGDYDFYMCGPGAFMQDLYTGLRELNIADERIRFEAFGPASVKRENAVPAAPGSVAVIVPFAQPAAAPRDPAQLSKVVFTKSGKDAMWSKEDGNLLDFAEANGLTPPSMCRSGYCGTCSTRVVSGDVSYAEAPDFEAEPGHALICCATPARTGAGEASTVVLEL